MTDDRTLLEMAAKAAGIELTWDDHGNAGHWANWRGLPQWTPWNPLADEGDALRLAVKLGIGLGIDMQNEIVTAYAPNPISAHFEEDAHDADAHAATRRAIVRAAAAIAQDGGART